MGVESRLGLTGQDPGVERKPVSWLEPQSGNLQSEQFVPKETREELSRAIITTYSGLDRYLREGSNGQNFIVDAYMVSPVETDPIPPEQAIQQLRTHRDTILTIGLDRLPEEWETVADSLLATQIFITEKFRNDGRRTPYIEYYPQISGDVLKPVSKDDLKKAKDQFIEALKASGEKFDETDDGEIRKAFQIYLGTRRILSKQQVENGLKRHDKTFRSALARVLKTPGLEDFQFSFRWRRESAPWKCWERLEPDGFYLDLNEAKLRDWFFGEDASYTLHEIEAHFGMLYLQSEEIKKGRLDSVAGILPTPDPRSWVFEGVAQTLDTLAGLKLGLDGELAVTHYRMYMRARSNAIFKLEVEGADLDSTVSEMRPYAPDKLPMEIKNELAQCLTDPFWRAYGAIYGTSDSDVLTLADNLGNGMRNIVLQQLFRRPMTRNQLIRMNLGVFLGR